MKKGYEPSRPSHMPFLHSVGGGLGMLFCKGEKFVEESDGSPPYRLWKIHGADLETGEEFRINTTLPEDVVECSPSCYESGGKVHLAFIGAKWDKGRYDDLRLYKMSGASLLKLSGPERVVPFPVRAGFERDGLVVFSMGDGRILKRAPGMVGRQGKDSGLEEIIRIAPVFDDPATILITGYMRGSEAPTTIVCDLEKDEPKGALSFNGERCYKPSVLGRLLAEAVGGDDNQEEYAIRIHELEE